MKHNKVITVIRCGFAGWIIFELLNWLTILHFTLDFSWLGLVLTATFVWVSIELISKNLRKKTGSGFPWVVYLVSFAGTSWDALGDVGHLYSRFSWYDQAAHFAGGASLGLIFFMYLWRLHSSRIITLTPGLMGFLAWSAANIIGVFYELEEYTESVLVHNNRLGDAFDTPNDLMWNIIGSLIVIVIASRYVRRLQVFAKKSS